MSHSRQPLDSHQSSGGGRGWGRHRERAASRDMHGAGDGGVVRDRRRSASSDRDYQNGGPLPPVAGGHGRPSHGRWGYESRHRGGTVSGMGSDGGRDWERDGRWERDYAISRSRDSGHDGERHPPSLSSRHTMSSLGRQGRTSSQPHPPPPHFGRRATEPGESLEEGELGFEERGGASRPRGTASRTYTMTGDGIGYMRRGEPHSSAYRQDRRSPVPSAALQPPHQSTHQHTQQYTQGRGSTERKFSYSSYRSAESRHASRPTTPTHARQPPPPPLPPPPPPARQPAVRRTPSPGNYPSRKPSVSYGTSDKVPPSSARSLGLTGSPLHSVRASARLEIEVKAQAQSVGGGAARRTPDPEDRTPSPKPIAEDVPKQQLESRISDIDREIAEYKEQLVQISGTHMLPEPGEPIAKAPKPGAQGSNTGDDRAVPTSPPAKAASVAVAIAGSIQNGPGTTGDSTKRSVTAISGDPGTKLYSEAVDQTAPTVPQTGMDARRRSSTSTEAVAASGRRVDGDMGLGSGGGQTADMVLDSVAGTSSSAMSSDDDDRRDSLPPKDKLLGLVDSIYAENQRKAAEVQARMAQPFLNAYPTFVPGAYSSPSDWPFWQENERINEKIRPHLVRMLAREKLQDQSHSRRLQIEYSELYAKWRKRVDKLDRQREAKQRGLVGAAGSVAAGPGPSPGGSGQSGFGSTTHRRRHAVAAASSMAADEFGFSLGPLFSANLSSEIAGRGDDSLFTSDAVHSEAELQAIIERLQHDDARNPDLRSQRTAATIPNMVIDPKGREMLRFNNNSHLVEDPLTFYHAKMPSPETSAYRQIAYGNNADSDHYWTQSEASAFVTAYLTYPKEFGKIAAHIPHKSMNDCVLFYYRNKKPLRLKELEAKSHKRARRSRQAGSVAGGGRRRKERARERRERKTREEREKMAMEAAAECAPVDHAAIESCATPAEDGLTTNGRTSEDDQVLSREASDILERRSKSSALLRSIIAANRQRKKEAIMGGASLLSLDDKVAGIDEMPSILSPVAVSTPLPAYDEEEEASADGVVSPGAPTPATVLTGLGARAKHAGSPEKPQQRADEQSIDTAMSSLPPSVAVSSVNTRTQQEDDGEDTGDGTRPEPESVADEEEEDAEEEGELVEDKHWEPRRRSKQQQQQFDYNAYAMGGSIVRTRRSRELEQQSQAQLGYVSAESGASDDYSVYSERNRRRRRRRSSLLSTFDEEDEEIVEASGIVTDRGSAAVSAKSPAKDSRPRIVSRRSQSRFGAMFTAVIDPDDDPDALAKGNEADSNSSGLVMVRHSLETPLSPLTGAASQDQQQPKESDLDRYVAEEARESMRPLGSHETLMMYLTGAVSPPAGATVVTAGADDASGTKPQSAQQLRRELEIQVEAECGPQESVLVGAAVWLQEDRRRVLRGFHKLGADFAQVASLMPSKTTAQCRYFYYHYRTPTGALISETISGSSSAAMTFSVGKAANPQQQQQQQQSQQLPTVAESLVLPPPTAERSQSTSLALPPSAGPNQKTKGRAASKTPGATPRASSLQLPVAGVLGAKRQRTGSPGDRVSSDDDDDEMPLAAQLAEELAAQAALERSHPSTPVMGQMPTMQQRRASDITQVRSDMLNRRMTPIASLVLPAKAATPSGSDMPLSANSSLHGPISATGRTPSPTVNPAAPAMTAKKSGYSSYWSVLERSSFMHYIVRLGQNWQQLAEAIGTKTGTQVRNYFRANREKLSLDAVVVEFERNKAAGTLPPMVPFQPGMSAGDPQQSQAKEKEKRGRKRKGEAARTPTDTSSQNTPTEAQPRDFSALAKGSRPPPEQQQQQQQPSVPSTAPASVTNFPTMGVDGGRAVVFTRPPPPPPPQKKQPDQPAQSYAPPPTTQRWAHQPVSTAMHAATIPAHGGAQQAYPRPAPYQQRPAPPPAVVGRESSNTPMSQPTPPPVEGLPRFSSSPAPSGAQPSRPASLSALHISNLTAPTATTRPQRMPPPPPSPPVVEEPRKVSVTKINALLNDEPSSEQHAASDWFDKDESSSNAPPAASAVDDEATGIAALALASMMGSARASPPAQAQPQPRHTVAYPQPRAAYAHSGRPSDPLPPVSSVGQQPMHSVSGSAFSPVARGSPMMSPPPPAGQQQHMYRSQSRPSSVGPSAYGQSPTASRHIMSPLPGARQIAGGQSAVYGHRQRKPSAPPLPSASSSSAGSMYVSRASMSVGSTYSQQQQQQQQQQYSAVDGRPFVRTPTMIPQSLPQGGGPHLYASSPQQMPAVPSYDQMVHRQHLPPPQQQQQQMPPAGYYYSPRQMSPAHHHHQQQQQSSAPGGGVPGYPAPYHRQLPPFPPP